MTSRFEGFISDIVTVTQLDSAVADIQDLIACLYKTSTPLRKQIDSVFLHTQAEWLLKNIKQPLNIERLHTTESMLTELISFLQQIRVCTLTVATSLTFSQILDIQEWLMQTTHSPCLIDLQIDRSLIGGAKIQYQGRIADKSLKLLLTDDEILRHIS